MPNRVDLVLKCKNIKTLNVGQAFSHSQIAIQGHESKGIYKFTLELAHPDENKYGQFSALQVAAQGLQRLSIIPFRDWSFEEPKFYSHQRTPASVNFVKAAKNVYPQQSDWGDLLWDLDSSKDWNSLSSSITPDRKNGPEKLFRTGCTCLLYTSPSPRD